MQGETRDTVSDHRVTVIFVVSYREDVILDDVRLLSEEQYDKSVTELIKSGVEITVSSFDSCQDAMTAAKILESYFNSTGDFSQR